MVDLIRPYSHPHVQLCYRAFCINPLVRASGAGAAPIPPVDGEGGGVPCPCLSADVSLEGLSPPSKVLPCFLADGGHAIVEVRVGWW